MYRYDEKDVYLRRPLGYFRKESEKVELEFSILFVNELRICDQIGGKDAINWHLLKQVNRNNFPFGSNYALK